MFAAGVFFVAGMSYGEHAAARRITNALEEASTVQRQEASLAEESRPILRVAFQNGGDTAWLPAVTLVRLAFPEHTILLVGHKADLGALGSLKRVQLSVADFPSSVKKMDVGEAVMNSTKHGMSMDLVVEGPAIHKHELGGCSHGDKNSQWLQVNVDGCWNAYEDTSDGGGYACEHANPPLVRLDACASARVKGLLEGTATSYLWAPPVATAAEIYRAQLSDRRFAFMQPKPHDRPHFVAYLAHECKSHRTSFFNALLEAVDRKERRGTIVGGVHGLGPCSHNHRWSKKYASPPMDTPQSEVYKEYRFVLAFENEFEEGYVTETLAAALAAGAVPIYYGDADAAARVFDRRTFVDVREFFRSFKRADDKPLANKVIGTTLASGTVTDARPKAVEAAVWLGEGANTSRGAISENEENITDKDWEALAAYVLALDADEERYNAFLRNRAFADEVGKVDKGGPRPFPLGDVEGSSVLIDPGMEYGIKSKDEKEVPNQMSSDVKAAVATLRSVVKPGKALSQGAV